MPKSSLSARGLPPEAQQSLGHLGRNLGIIRRERGMTQAALAERLMVNVETVSRMEHGDTGVGVGIWAHALWLMGQSGRMVGLLSLDTTVPIVQDNEADEAAGPARNDF